jgi:hypothetical protein
MNRTAKLYYVLGQNVSVDEMQIVYSGRHVKLQYMPAKPHKWCFLVYGLCDSDSGFLHNFVVYQGSTTPIGKMDGLGSYDNVVFQLVLGASNFARHTHVIFMDNLFSSVKLFHLLKQRGFNCIGTMRTNKRALSAALKAKAQSFKSSKVVKGTIFMQMLDLGGDGNIYAIVWKDKKPVKLLSTIEGHLGAGFKTWERKEKIPKPTQVMMYNGNMGGNDKHDQHHSNYRIRMKSVKWPRAFYNHFVTTAVVQAWLTRKQSVLFRSKNLASHAASLTAPKKKQTHLQFIKELVDGLLAPHLINIKAVRKPSSCVSQASMDVKQGFARAKGKKRKSPELAMRLDLEHHHSMCWLPKKGKANDRRVGCVVCTQRTGFGCSTCSVALCMPRAGDDVMSPCQEEFHTLSDRQLDVVMKEHRKK